MAALAGSLPPALLYAMGGAAVADFQNATLIFGLVLMVAGAFWLIGLLTVVKNLDAIKGVLTLPTTNPSYMQVTRDMSPDKVKMILRWIELGAPPSTNGGTPTPGGTLY